MEPNIHEVPGKADLLAASSRIFEFLLDWFPDIIWSVDAAGNLAYSNRQAAELLGYQMAELRGMNLRQLYAPEVHKHLNQGFSTLQADGVLTVESILLTKAGERIPVEIRSFAVYGDDGAFLRSFSILRDVRQIKDLQQSLVHAGRLAAVGELAACVAHDISNPLSVIGLYSELLEQELKMAQTASGADMSGAAGSVASIRKASERIGKLVSHLVGFCRSNEPVFKEVDLLQVFEDGLFMIANKLNKSGVRVSRKLPDGPCLSWGDANELELVFMNLFSNACDAMRGQNRPAELTICLARKETADGGEYWECTVADTGCGMTSEVAEQIFTAFFTTKEKGKGTGLGLSIARNIVKQHKGEIKVASAPGSGTTFTVTLPAV